MKKLLLALSLAVVASPMLAMSRFSAPVAKQFLRLVRPVPLHTAHFSTKAFEHVTRNQTTNNIKKLALNTVYASAIGATAYSAMHLNKCAAQDHIIEIPDKAFAESYDKNELLSLFTQAKNDNSTGTVFVIIKNNTGGLEDRCDQAIQEIECVKSENKHIVAIILDQASSGGIKLALSANYVIARKHAKLGSVGVCSVVETFDGHIIATSGSSKMPEAQIEMFLNNNPHSIVMVYDIIDKTLSTYKTTLLAHISEGEIVNNLRFLINTAITGHNDFINHIIQNRSQRPNFKPEHFKYWQNAQVFSALDAFKYGLVDHVVKSDATAEEIIQAYNKGEKGLQAIAK